MIEKIKKVLSLVSLAIPAVYIVGFVIVNSYLAKYSIYDYEALSFNYLKAGIFFMVLIGLALVCIFASFGIPSDNLSKTYHQFPILFHNCLLAFLLLVALLFSPFSKLFNLLSHQSVLFFASILSFPIYVLTRLYVKDLKSKSKRNIIVISLFQGLLLLMFLIPILIQAPHLKNFLIFFLIFTLLLSVSLGEFFDGKYNLLNLPFSLMGLLFAATYFGYNVFGHVPTYGGGPKIQTESIFFSDSIDIGGKKAAFLEKKEILYLSGENYFIGINDSTVIQVNANEIKSVNYNRRINR